MDDNRFKELFEQYSSELTLDKGFEEKVINGIDALDIVIDVKEKEKRTNLFVAIFSATLGFICGVVLTLLYPSIESFTKTAFLNFMQSTPELEIWTGIISYALIAFVCLSVTFGSYFMITPLRNYFAFQR